MKKFTLMAAFAAMTISASAQSVVTTSGSSLNTIKNAQDVIVVSVSDAVKKAFTDAKVIKADYSVDEVTHFLYVWDETYTGGTSTGMNSVGLAEGWVSLVVSNIGWSGAGFAGKDPGKDVSIIDDDYKLHFALKSNDNATHVIGVGESKMAIGNAAFPDKDTTIPVLENFPRDGKWYNFDIPVSVMKNYIVGNKWFNEEDLTKFKGNLVWWLSGGVAGTTFDIDQVFFYHGEVGTDGIQSVKAENESAAAYNLAGQKVDANFKGIVVKNGKKYMK
ncbi:MAG: hypothetical protein IJ549_06810 [Prevotella sp.]|nr:hypothetical protein [Prevotella sp.]